MFVDLRRIPDEGLLLDGEEPSEVFDLEDEAVRAVSPIRYRLLATIRKSKLFLDGWIEAAFELRCGRCLEFFPLTVRIDPCQIVEIVENTETMDLTDRIREDILLDLPGYPKCEQADSARICPELARISPGSEYKLIETSGTENESVWGVLDDLKPETKEES